MLLGNVVDILTNRSAGSLGGSLHGRLFKANIQAIKSILQAVLSNGPLLDDYRTSMQTLLRFPTKPAKLGVSRRPLVRWRRTPPNKDHIIHDFVVLCSLVRSDRLSIVGNVIDAESPVEADLAIT